MRSTLAIDYRIAANLRRCCWYVITGALALAVVYCWLAKFIQNRGDVEIAFACTVFALLAAATIVPLRWKLRLDERGITRCTVLGSDLWRWHEFASGRILKRHPYTLSDPDRPWWRRNLRLGHLSGDDASAVMKAVNEYYRLPPAPELADRMVIKYGFRQAATLHDRGVRLTCRGVQHNYSWNDVQGIYITRMDMLRRDFWRLEIVLSDREIELKLITHEGGTSPSWRGATAEAVNEFLHRYVAEERIDIHVEGKRYDHREHLEKRLREAEKSQRDFARTMVFLLVAFPVFLVWLAFDRGVVASIIIGGFFAILSSPLVFVHRVHKKRVDNLHNQLDSLDEGAEPTAGDVAGCHET